MRDSAATGLEGFVNQRVEENDILRGLEKGQERFVEY